MENTTSVSIFFVAVRKHPNEYFVNAPLPFNIAWMILPVFGIVTNAINIKTFTAIGIEDGVSVSLLALSLSDFFFSFSSFLLGCAMLGSKLESIYDIIFPIDPFVFCVQLYSNTIALAYTITGMTTTFLAVARCMCVAKPLHFRYIFTRSRSIIIHITFMIISISGFAAGMLQMGTVVAFDSNANQTRRVLWLSDIRDQVKDVIFFTFDFVVAFATLIVMIACVIIMARSLIKSAKFRHKTKAADSVKGIDSSYKLAGKELQVVKQVVLISTMYIICSIPKTFNSVYNLIEPEFAIGMLYQDFYYDMHYVRNGFEIVNAASTLFIYYNFNSKFRAQLLNGSCCCRKKEIKK